MPQRKVIFFYQIPPQFKIIKVYAIKFGIKIHSKSCQFPAIGNQKMAVFQFKFGNLVNQISFSNQIFLSFFSSKLQVGLLSYLLALCSQLLLRNLNSISGKLLSRVQTQTTLKHWAAKQQTSWIITPWWSGISILHPSDCAWLCCTFMYLGSNPVKFLGF